MNSCWKWGNSWIARGSSAYWRNSVKAVKLHSFPLPGLWAVPCPHPEHLLGLRFHIFVSCEISCYHSCGKATTLWAVWGGQHAQCPLPARHRGEGKRQKLAVLRQPGPWKMPGFRFRTCTVFSCSHLAAAKRSRSFAFSSAAALWKAKKGRGVYFWKTNFLQALLTGVIIWTLSGLHEMLVISLCKRKFCWTGLTNTSAFKLLLLEKHWKDAKISLLWPRTSACHKGKWFI